MNDNFKEIKTESNINKSSGRNSINNKKDLKKRLPHSTKKMKINKKFVLLLLILLIYIVVLVFCLCFFLLKKKKDPNDNFPSGIYNNTDNNNTNNNTNDISTYLTDIISNNLSNNLTNEITDIFTDNNYENESSVFEIGTTDLTNNIIIFSDIIDSSNNINQSQCEIGEEEKCLSCDSDNITCISCNLGYKLLNGKCILNYSFKEIYQINNENEIITLILFN